jgi:hypothetical protein
LVRGYGRGLFFDHFLIFIARFHTLLGGNVV